MLLVDNKQSKLARKS